MPWTTPATWTAGQVIGATDLNTQLRDNLSYLCVERPNAYLIRTGTSDYSTTLATFSDMDAANLILTVANVQSGRLLVLVSLMGAADNTAASAAEFDVILDSTTRAGGTHGLIRVPQNNQRAVVLVARFTGVSVGSHTVKLQYRNATAGAAAQALNNAYPITLWATEF